MKYKTNMTALDAAIKSSGNQTMLAKELTSMGLRTSKESISMWKKRKSIPLAGALLIEELHCQPDRYALCPERFK